MAGIKNLIATDGDDRIIWNPESGHLETGEGKTKQILITSSRPYFSITSISLSPIKNLLALIGDNGVTIVELPRKWGGRYKSDRDNQVFCRTYNLNERLFTCEKRLRICQAVWHPCGTEAKQIICILTNDNRMRIHDAIENHELQAISLRTVSANDYSEDDEDDICLNLSMLNLGSFAICFDFGPPMVIQDSEVLWPLYILMGTGDIYLLYTNFRNPTWAEHIIGPLTILPQAEDNYGSDACSLIVLDSSPPMLAIATRNGFIHHCFAFADKQTLFPRQTLYVYESIELSKDLIENPEDCYSPHPMRLSKDPTSDIRYFCVHQNGVHTIVLPILESIQTECDMSQDKESFTEFLLCTRTSTPSDTIENVDDLSTPKGLGVEIRQANINLLVLMHDYQLIVRKIPSAATLINRKRFPRRSKDTSHDSSDLEILNVSQIDAARSNFVEQMDQILKRKTSVPVLKLSKDLEQADKVGDLFNEIVNTFKTEYIKKYNMAVEAIKKKLTILEDDMKNQSVEFDSIQKRKEDVYNSVLVLDSKTAISRTNQANIMSRIEKLLSELSSGGGELSEDELKLKRELTSLHDKIRYYRDQLDSIIAKHKYHMDQRDPSLKSNRDLILSQSQLNGIKDTLSRQGAEIAELKRMIKAVEE